MTNAIKMTIAKNGAKMYYVDGKRISRDKAIEISKNADNEMLTNALGANVELKDAQAILVIATKDPLEAGKDREFGWCFTNVVDAVEAAKKVAALFGDRFIKADVRGDAKHFDNRIIATVDKAGNVEIKKQTPEYIFTTYQTVTGVDCNGRTEHVESFATTCKELGDADNFTGLYRAVTFYEDWHYNAWDIKTADGKLIAKGNTEAELKKAYEAIKAGNVEVSKDVVEIETAANGNVMFYLNGNRAKEADLVKAAIAKDQPYYKALVQKRGESKFVAESFLSTITAYKWLCRMARKNVGYADGYMAISLEKVIHTPTCTTLTGTDIYTNKMSVEDISDKHLKNYIKQQADTGEVSDNKPVWEDPHKYETVGNLEHARHLYSEFNAEDNAGEVSEEIAADAVVETTNDTGIDTDETAAADEPMSDDISDICKYNPDLKDDDKPCRLDWDDSAIAHIPTGEEELAAFINPQIVIEEGYLEPTDKIAAAKPKHSRRQLRDLIDSNLAEINYYLDGLDECSADENCPQSHIDFLHDKIKNLGKKYRQYYREYRDMHAEEIAG